MRLLLCVVALIVGTVACGSKSKPPPEPKNTSTVAAPLPKPPVARFTVEVAPGRDGVSLEGTFRDIVNKEPMMGATVVMTSPALVGEQVNLTDESGKVSFSALPAGKYEMTVYYNDTTEKTALEIVEGKLVKVSLDWAPRPRDDGQTIVIDAKPVEYPNWKAALEAGSMYQAYQLGEKEAAKKATAQLHGMLAITRYATAIDTFSASAFRSTEGQPRGKQLRASLVQLSTDLDKVQAHLAEAAKDPQFAFELCVACVMAADGVDIRLAPPGLFEVERDRKGKELPENDPKRRPTYRFDSGDLAWGRAMVSFQQALVNISLAYDFDWIDKLAADFDADADKADDKTLKVTIKLVEPARIAKAKELVLAGLDFSDQSRAAYLVETDDDREWVPSPKQKNYSTPLVVDAALYKSWEQIVGDVRTLVAGDTGISLAAVWKLFGARKNAPVGFIDVGAMFKNPKDIIFQIGAIDRIESEKNPKKAKELTTLVLQGALGDGYKTTMKPSKLTDRLLQIRNAKDTGADQAFEDKLKYLLWVN